VLGVVAIHKPSGLTSARVVDQVRKRLGTREVGHAGTLDPLAEGLLVLCVGRARRLQELLMQREKGYRARVRLGGISFTDDAEGPITPVRVPVAPTEEEVARALAAQVGAIAQRPPAISAVKTGGRRAYRAARRGEPVTLPPRQVVVHEITLLGYDYPEVELDVGCGRGTYIRSIARDLGEALGTGGYLDHLVRTRACGLELTDAVPLAGLEEEHLLPLDRVLSGEPRVELPPGAQAALADGKVVPCEGVPPVTGDAPLFAWIEGRVMAWVRVVPGGVQARRQLTPS
jgi:tRNA pseudouridine55 synthase